MSENEEYPYCGTVVLDGVMYYITSVDESDCFAPGTRFVSLSLVYADPEDQYR